MKNILSLVLCAGIVSACSHEVAITYDCVPSGAVVYEQDVGTLGTCPLIVKYNTDDVNFVDNKVRTNKMKVTWNSGATLFVPPSTIDIPPDGNATFTLTRPDGFVNYAGDDSEKQDEKYGIAYDDNLPSPQQRYIVTAGQKKGFFDRLDSSASCLWTGILEDPYARCD